MTPCSLYELRRKDLEVVVDVYPNIRRALEQENNRRQQKNVNSAIQRTAIASPGEDVAIVTGLGKAGDTL
jgi:CRP-like cAMP-binding protein